MITRDTLVTGTLPRITPHNFAHALAQAASPAAGDAPACYRAVAPLAVDPLFALAVFRHESNFGRAGICATYQTRNPGNTRSTRTGIGEIITTQRGPFVRYPSWPDGFRDLAFRLVDPSYVYRQHHRRTIADIIPTFAPVSDGNAPNSYISAVEAFMRQLEQPQVPGLDLVIDLIPLQAHNRPGWPMQPTTVTVHETANPRPGADALAHRNFAHNGGGPERVSFHFVVDDHRAVQLLPMDEVAWHAGDGPDGPGNRTSLAVETCVNHDADWPRTLDNLARLLAAICRMYGWGVDRIVQHHTWSGKNCPTRLRQAGWSDLIAQVQRYLDDAGSQGSHPAASHARYFPETGHSIAGGFRAYWEQFGGLPIFGYPLTGEITEPCEDGQVRTVQYFERAVFEWHPDKPELADRYHVLLRRLGAMVLERRQVQ
jgi:N-acetylmuramoyl-L-alanine amidase